MIYERFYPNGWQSGETGGTPITPEALNHIENGIRQTYSDFAPAGYGLGTLGTKPNDLNACLTNGWYWVTDTTLNVPTEFIYGSVFVRQRLTNQVTQYLFAHLGSSTGCQMIRRTVDGGATWIEEWVNPPMTVGVEYCTSERWGGKVVYTIAINCGEIPNKGTSNVTTPIPASAKLLSLQGKVFNSSGAYAQDMPFVSPTTTNVLAVCTMTTSMNVTIRSFADTFTGYTCVAVVKYTKD